MKYNLFEINERLQNGEITSEQAHKELLILHGVVVPKGTLCECKKHSLKTNYGFEVCTKCGNEFDD
jgi:hypothetical protein